MYETAGGEPPHSSPMRVSSKWAAIASYHLTTEAIRVAAPELWFFLCKQVAYLKRGTQKLWELLISAIKLDLVVVPITFSSDGELHKQLDILVMARTSTSHLHVRWICTMELDTRWKHWPHLKVKGTYYWAHLFCSYPFKYYVSYMTRASYIVRHRCYACWMYSNVHCLNHH